ncbi:MAG: hypothetical protein CSYNP_00805 [Syntrophus sp. SKADARSKE-3]|nr:hypothetical protein [Syntrophus sp. SKADARSKE-3]
MFRKPERIGTCPRKGHEESCSARQQMCPPLEGVQGEVSREGAG